MMILAVLKRLGRSLAAANFTNHGKQARRTDENTFSVNWMGYTDIEGLVNKNVAILGMGEIEVELARRLKGSRVPSIYYNKRQRYPMSAERELWLHYGDTLECVKKADVLVSLLPSRRKQIAASIPGRSRSWSSVLVHLGSGSVIDEQALVEALPKKLAGAALDTYEYEPLQPTHSLVQLAREITNRTCC